MSSLIQRLVGAYQREVSLTWPANLSPAERVWIVIYPPSEERRLRVRIGEFELATTAAGHRWVRIDVTGAFGEWMGIHPYRDALFEEPEELAPALVEDFPRALTNQIRQEAMTAHADENTVVALTGVGALFGVARVSELLTHLQSVIPGRLLVMFPGDHEGNNYRFLDARDGWNYLARPIVATEATQ